MWYEIVVWGVLILLVAPSVNAALDIQETTLEFGSSSQEKSSELRTITLKKNFNLRFTAGSYYHNLESLFSPSNNFQSSNLVIANLSTEVDLRNQTQDSSRPFTINLTVPRDFDAVNNNLEAVKFSIGQLRIKARINGSPIEETSDPLELFLQVENNLEIQSVKVEREDESEVSVSRGNTVSVTAGERIKVKFEVKNTFENETGTSFDTVTVNLESSDLGLDEEEDTNGIDPNSVATLRMAFTIDDDETGTFDVLVKAGSEDEFQGLHGVKYDFKFNVAEVAESEEEISPGEEDTDGDNVPDLDDFCPVSTAGCSVDASGCEIDSDNDGICDSLDQTPRGEDAIVLEEREPTLRPASNNDNVTTHTSQQKPDALSAVSTEAFAPFLIGFVLGIILTAGFFIFIRS